jgi:hypothetical protein
VLLNGTGHSTVPCNRADDPVVQPLAVPFLMIMDSELLNSLPQRAFPEEITFSKYEPLI